MAGEKPPYYRRWVSDFLGSPDVRAMTAEQVGFYQLLMDHSFHQELPCHLPDDTSILWRLAQAESRKDFEKKWAPVRKKFDRVEVDGVAYLVNLKMLSEYENACGRMKAGKRGADARWHAKDMRPHSDRTCEPDANQNQNQSKVKTTPLPPKGGVQTVENEPQKRTPARSPEGPRDAIWQGVCVELKSDLGSAHLHAKHLRNQPEIYDAAFRESWLEVWSPEVTVVMVPRAGLELAEKVRDRVEKLLAKHAGRVSRRVEFKPFDYAKDGTR